MSAPLDIAPLSGVEEAAQVALLLTVASPDSPLDDLCAGVAQIINHGRPAGSQVHAAELQALISERLQGRYPRQPLLQLAADARQQAAEQLAASNLLVAAAPRATACCVCGGTSLQPKLLKAAAFFYSEQHGPRTGRLYKSECRSCKAMHYLDGFEPTAGGPRRMYADAALQHPDWMPAGWRSPSSETLIATSLLQRHMQTLHRSAVAFEAEADVYNDLFSPGEGGRSWAAC